MKNITNVRGMKQINKGITLIALVITIIVLLILAGITIATLTGENGILTKADTAKQETTKQGAKEKVQVEVMGSYDNNGKIDMEELNNNLKNNIEGLTYQGKPISDTNKIEKLSAIVVVDGYNVKIHENGKVIIEGEKATEDNNNTNNGGATQEPPQVNNVAIPGEIVIGDENKTYTKNGTATIPVGFAIVPGLDDISEGLVISDVANDIEDEGNQFVWIPVADETPYERNRTYELTSVSTTAYDDTDYLPDGIINEEDAVRSAGGFYISRYEAGKEGTDTLASKKGANVWNEITHENSKEVAKTMYTGNTHVKSALISGIQWDMTMVLVNGKMDGTNEFYYVTQCDSRRHAGESRGIEKAGNNEADKVCNIYDLEGNALEFTAEKYEYKDDFNDCVSRGGDYYYGTASFRNGGNGGLVNTSFSFRLVLYVR